jgi:hypothetical protein
MAGSLVEQSKILKMALTMVELLQPVAQYRQMAQICQQVEIKH